MSKRTREGEALYAESAKNPKREPRLIVVLEQAVLETVAMKKGYELLNSDDHQRVMRRKGRDFSLARPDIAHQALLNLFDSPLNKAGLLRVYVHTARNVLIELSPATRIPRTYKRFAGLMVQLLHEQRIVAASEGEATAAGATLLKVIANPVTQYLPLGARRVGTSSAARLVDLDGYLREKPDGPMVFVLGAISKGEVAVDYVDETIAFSAYPLSAALACAKLCSAFERRWGIL